jgi:toxin CptA
MNHFPFPQLVAVVCAGVMGLAVQRGGTCAVAAVEEVVTQRNYRRFRALAEATFWSAGLMALAFFVFGKAVPVRTFGVTEWTVLGGVLLGLGAWINGACVFGTVAAIGGGDWAYLFFPVGFLLGCASLDALVAGSGLASALPQTAPAATGFTQFAPVMAALFCAWLLFRGWQLIGVLRQQSGEAGWRGLLRGEWPLHVGTIVVAAAFVLMALVFGQWVYTDALAEFARGAARPDETRFWLFGAMLAGSLAGGVSLRKWRPVAPTAGAVTKCLLGGWIMAVGFLLVPGANDSIILLGLPTLQPQAWAGIPIMMLTLWLLIALKRYWRTI